MTSWPLAACASDTGERPPAYARRAHSSQLRSCPGLLLVGLKVLLTPLPSIFLVLCRALNGMPPARAAQAALRLLAEVQELLGADEASLRSAVKTAASSGGEDENQNPLVNWGLASVLEAYRLGTACAQAAGDIASTMQARDAQPGA